MKRIIVYLLFAAVTITFAQNNFPYKNPKLPVQKRVDDLVKRMTLEEKIDLLSGTGFATKPIERLGIPELRMSDGPMGVRWGEATAFPSGIALAATWNPNQTLEVGKAISRELQAKDRHVILGPCVNIARLPQGGRNFESYGEDPFLAKNMTVNYIKGVQQEGAAATVKHFAVNNQEYKRETVDVLIGERALNEIYLPAFKAAVIDADVLCVMSAYNKLNGKYCSENDQLLIDKLKKEWNFKGLIMSDWGAVHSTIPTIKNGLDLEMPDGKFLNRKTLLDEAKNDDVLAAKIDDKVKRILTVIFKLGLFDKKTKENLALIDTDENRNIAYKTSLESIVLLKNENNILPLKTEIIKTVAVIGPSADIARTGGGGSSYVNAIKPVSALQGLQSRLGNKVQIKYAEGIKLEQDANLIPSKYLFTDASLSQHGLSAEYFNNPEMKEIPSVTRIDTSINFTWDAKGPTEKIGPDNFSARWTGVLKVPVSGAYVLSVSSDDGSRLYIDDQLLIDNWGQHAMLAANTRLRFNANQTYKVKIEYSQYGGGAGMRFGWTLPNEDPAKVAVETAKNSDLVLLFVGTNSATESESIDREDLYLPSDQDELIMKIAEANPNVVVVIQAGSPIVMNRWIEKVKGVVDAWFPGTEGGNAIADVLIGNYNPSGKIPITFPKRWEDCSAFKTYKMEEQITRYDDGIFVGYRHFDKNNIEPLYPFGYGLSFTTFEYSNLSISSKAKNSFEVSFTIKNTGKVDGAEVTQLYVGQQNPKVERAAKELKGFKRVDLKAGESLKVKLLLKDEDFAYYDESIHGWKVDPGKYDVMIGASSRDLKLKQLVDIK
jgi:beta-glucosidase